MHEAWLKRTLANSNCHAGTGFSYNVRENPKIIEGSRSMGQKNRALSVMAGSPAALETRPKPRKPDLTSSVEIGLLDV